MKESRNLGLLSHRLSDYIKGQGFHVYKDPNNDDPDLPYIYLRVAIIQSITFIFSLYRPQDNGTVFFNWISDKINNTTTEYPSASSHVFGDFKIHHKDVVSSLKLK